MQESNDKPQNDAELVRSIVDSLDQSSQSLPPGVQARLAAARKAAIAQMAEQNQLASIERQGLAAALLGWLREPRWSVAVASLLAVTITVLVLTRPGEPKLVNKEAEPTTIEILVQEQDLEFFDDIAFYQWLAEQKPNAS